MFFFKSEEKRLAERIPAAELKRRYEASEERLVRAARRGSLPQIRKEMRKHHKYEYALLYKDYAKNRQSRRKGERK